MLNEDQDFSVKYEILPDNQARIVMPNIPEMTLSALFAIKNMAEQGMIDNIDEIVSGDNLVITFTGVPLVLGMLRAAFSEIAKASGGSLPEIHN